MKRLINRMIGLQLSLISFGAKREERTKTPQEDPRRKSNLAICQGIYKLADSKKKQNTSLNKIAFAKHSST
jgi:hypothetical protein